MPTKTAKHKKCKKAKSGKYVISKKRHNRQKNAINVKKNDKRFNPHASISTLCLFILKLSSQRFFDFKFAIFSFFNDYVSCVFFIGF